jgi:hypothetical protein
MIVDERLTLPLTTSIPLDRFQEAMAMSDGGPSDGKKILLSLSPAASLAPHR